MQDAATQEWVNVILQANEMVVFLGEFAETACSWPACTHAVVPHNAVKGQGEATVELRPRVSYCYELRHDMRAAK